MLSEQPLPDPEMLRQAEQLLRQRATQSAPTSRPSATDFQRQMLVALHTISLILAARFILLLAVCGACLLAYLAVSSPDLMKTIALGVYNLTVLGPLVWLTATRN
jgi:hypothetical protein